MDEWAYTYRKAVNLLILSAHASEYVDETEGFLSHTITISKQKKQTESLAVSSSLATRRKKGKRVR